MNAVAMLGEYTLVEKIAAGGMAEIWRAELRGIAGFKREVAIKRILPQHTHDEQFVTMLLDEARIAARLVHPNIAQVINCGCVDGSYFIVMELVDGRALSRVLKLLHGRGQRLRTDEALQVGVGLLRALGHAHAAVDDNGKPMNIVHRDVSPQNLLVARSGEVKLVDFGVASAANKLHKTATGVVKGKIIYMAPEQVAGASAIDARADQYAAALVVVEALTGERVFDGTTELEIIKRVIEGATGDYMARLEAAGTPKPVSEALNRALSRDPADRFSSCDELAQVLAANISGNNADISSRLGAHVRAVLEEEASRPPPPELRSGDPTKVTSHDGLNNAGTEAATTPLTPGAQRPRDVLAAAAAPPSTPARRVPTAVAAAAGLALALGIAALLVFRGAKEEAANVPVASSPVASSPVASSPLSPEPVAAPVAAPVAPAPIDAAGASPVMPHADKPPATTAPAADPAPPATARRSTPRSEPRAKATGMLDVACLPWCEVTIDGVATGMRSPVRRHPLPVGEHVIDVVNPPSGKSATRRVTIEAGATKAVTFRL